MFIVIFSNSLVAINTVPVTSIYHPHGCSHRIWSVSRRPVRQSWRRLWCVEIRDVTGWRRRRVSVGGVRVLGSASFGLIRDQEGGSSSYGVGLIGAASDVRQGFVLPSTHAPRTRRTLRPDSVSGAGADDGGRRAGTASPPDEPHDERGDEPPADDDGRDDGGRYGLENVERGVPGLGDAAGGAPVQSRRGLGV